VTEPKWEVVVGHYGKILILRYEDQEQAQNTYELIATAIDDWSDYKNDRKRTIRVTDDIGCHTFAAGETKSVSLVEIDPAIRANVAFEKRCNAIKDGEAAEAVEAQAAEVQDAQPEA
jgi:hypothetical protein